MQKGTYIHIDHTIFVTVCIYTYNKMKLNDAIYDTWNGESLK
jgi:hypothetical protein